SSRHTTEKLANNAPAEIITHDRIFEMRLDAADFFAAETVSMAGAGVAAGADLGTELFFGTVLFFEVGFLLAIFSFP
ncbi:MAG: hypothetical protein IKH46_13920, partial [Lachnospiraceae bacterium]|nr:hypothetical protein [Lachnospiraceae bacterium]